MADSHLLYVYVAKGAALKPGSLIPSHGRLAHYVTLPNGDAIGVFHATSHLARKTMEADPLITVFPELHRPLKPAHVTLLAYAGVVTGDTTYDAGEKLFEFHRMPWLHPANGPLDRSAASDYWPPQNPSTPAPSTSTAPANAAS